MRAQAQTGPSAQWREAGLGARQLAVLDMAQSSLCAHRTSSHYLKSLLAMCARARGSLCNGAGQ